VFPLKDNIPTRRRPYLTIAIIVICTVMYFGFQHGGLHGPSDENVVKYAVIPYEVTHPGQQCVPGGHPQCASASEQDRRYGTTFPATWITIFTAMFMHGGILHLAGNMLFLWIFGNNIEDSMSRWRFALFYLLGGIVATAGEVLTHAGSATPTLGASGAIAAVLAGYALLYPRARVLTLIFIIIFFTVIELPALFVLGFWFLLQLLSASSQSLGDSGVAYYAHIGGFLFGLLFIRLFANRVNENYDQASRLPVY
jgi:membrane associated rhomboid family serine protease